MSFVKISGWVRVGGGGRLKIEGEKKSRHLSALQKISPKKKKKSRQKSRQKKVADFRLCVLTRLVLFLGLFGLVACLAFICFAVLCLLALL